jgi:hypothetical protein
MKKALLLTVAAFLCLAAAAAETPDTNSSIMTEHGVKHLAVNTDGKNVLSMKGGVLSIAGFEITLNSREELHGELPADPRATTLDDILCRCGCGNAGCTCGKTQATTTSTFTGHYTVPVTAVRPEVTSRHKPHKVESYLDFGFTGFDGNAGAMKLNNGRSIAVGFGMRYEAALNPARTVWLSTGVGGRWNNYVFDDRITLGREGGKVVAVPLENAGHRFKKSKLGTFSFEVPLAAQFRIARVVRLETGVYGGIRAGDRTKVKFPKYKDKGNWDTNFWQAGAMARIKVKPVPFGLFATYSFTPLFEHGAGPRLNPFTIGIYLQ